MNMDVLDLPPPAEPIDNSILVVPKRTKQTIQSFNTISGTAPKTSDVINGAIEKKINTSTETNQLEVSKNDFFGGSGTKHNSEKKKKKKKKEKEKKMIYIPQQENRSPQTAPKITDVDYENKKKKEKEKKVIPQRENRSLQRAPKIPEDIDYEKLASAQMICSDITHPKYKKPFDYGWRRELVFRATVQENQKLGDVYYYTPNGFRLRSMVELAQVELQKGLTLDNFSFFPEPTGVNNLWKETIRAAVFRDKETVAQTRQDVRDRLKNVKRKLASNQPRKKMKRRRTLHSYIEAAEDYDIDNDMVDEMLKVLRNVKAEKDKDYRPDSRVSMDYDSCQETSPRLLRNAKAIKYERNESTSEENLGESRLSETVQKENFDQQVRTEGEKAVNELPAIPIKQENVENFDQQLRTEGEKAVNELPTIPIKQENVESQSYSKQHESSALQEIPGTTDKAPLKEQHVADDWANIIIKEEKMDKPSQPCVQDSGANEKLELIITDVQTQFYGCVDENESINMPGKVVEETQPIGEPLEFLGFEPLPEKNITVSTCDKAVQTMTEQDSKEIIERLQMENMFLKEKLANLEKSISSNSVSKKLSTDCSSSKNLVGEKSEKFNPEADCDVICVDQYVMNIQYDTIDLDSD
ncbi:hypothetical protein LSTR_LSTR007400 [Laodelphax striatellus]|uniref:MBD domain-containing protein n=1 Tax=Laodelphax striatellus TaxID=195883 RepID=A0A482XNJ1_LAOST|nr:hypothetical protein LSTR_LSTR007400 [Laodelphax striatellus]